MLLKLQHYHQSSVAVRCLKPFRVIKKTELVAYRFKLPQEAIIHDVFHVSQLKRYEETPTQRTAHSQLWIQKTK